MKPTATNRYATPGAPEPAQDVGQVPLAGGGLQHGARQGEREDRRGEAGQRAPHHLAGAGQVVGEVRRAQREGGAVADHEGHGREKPDRIGRRLTAGERGVVVGEGQVQAVAGERRRRDPGHQRRPRQHGQAQGDDAEHDRR